MRLILFATTILFIVVVSCDSENGDNSTFEAELEQLNILKSDIETLASSSICNEAIECKFIAFGSKPCGGPWSYLIYSTSIDTDQLENIVEDYNKKEAAFNTKWNIASDCSLTLQPTNVICENNTCVAIY